jgi:anti-sigma factor RsiW
MHLKEDQLVDLAEGTRPESSAPHLESCDACRRQLAELRAMMAVAADVDVPEPSPLFWDHLSERVRGTVAAQEPPRRAWLDVARWRRSPMPAWAIAAASVIVVVVLSSRLMAPQPPAGSVAPPATGVATTSTETIVDAAAADASLMLVASLTSGLDLEGAGEAGLAPSGSAEQAIIQMDHDELRELQRLLKEEMAL